ncbi:MAG: hypothetical protein U5L10_04300 [Candidatus Moranbacteria bacterium]|nr:hypothetical protein [Candidatus Moranbacteria bacterium]
MNKIITIILLLALVGLAVWAYPTVKKRYFSGQEEKIRQEKQETQEKQKSLEEKEQEEKEKELENLEEQKEPVPGEYEITIKNCNNRCQGITEPEKLEYCKQYCGLTQIQEKQEGDCDDLSGLEKDYCYKDLAVSQKDYKICEKISDEKIKQTCQNRITEEILDNQNNSEF